MNQSPANSERSPLQKGYRFAIPRWLWIGFTIVVVLVLLAPTIVTKTGAGQGLVKRMLPDDVDVNFDRVSFGWITPLLADQVTIVDKNETWSVHAKTLRGSANLVQLLLNSSDLGTATLKNATVKINVDSYQENRDKNDKPKRIPSKKRQKLRLNFEEVSVIVDGRSFSEPSQFAKDANLSCTYRRDETGEFLEIDSGRVIERAQLTPDMCRSALKYAVPILADVGWSKGEISVDVANCVLPLDSTQNSEVSGTVHIHNVETGIREEWASRIASLAALKSDKAIPTRIRIANESTVKFEMKDQRVHHEGLEFGLPEVSEDFVVRTHGYVGVDKTLDLTAELPLPLHLLGDGPIASALGFKSLTMPIKGTLDDPQAAIEGKTELASELITDLASPLLDGDASVEDLLSGLQELRKLRKERKEEKRRPRRDRGEGGLLDRLRQRLMESD